MTDQRLQITTDETTGQVRSALLYGEELLDMAAPCVSELWVNGRPLPMRSHTDSNQPGRPHLKGERFVDHFSGWGLVLARVIGGREGLKHPCVGIQTQIRRELCGHSLPTPGPGGPVVEAPLHVDTFGVLNWGWKFWGDDTRMIFPSSHSNGPADESGHIGYENDTPEAAKGYLQNVVRRLYPGTMVVHGGLFYNARTGHWLAITCRRPQVGYIVNIEDAGRGVGYDFTLHAPFGLGQSLQLPEIKLYYGQTHDEMMRWLADYATFYYEEPPAWVFGTTFGEDFESHSHPTWAQQADHWERRLDEGAYSGIRYSLVTDRPVYSGTTPLGYGPDPNYGTQAEFRRMCRRLADRGTPLLIWMSHSGMLYQGGPDIDDDWFIRGIDGRVCASWGDIDGGGLTHINPGHPGYIEYTKRWIRFYVGECGAKGIFFDCLGWAFPPDFRPRPWMRYPGDTNRMAIKFMDEIYACLKGCDPEAILMGEGTTLEGPVNVFSIAGNPKRAADGLGPRDFFLALNRWSPRWIVIDQGPHLCPASGFCVIAPGELWEEHNRYVTRLLRERGGRDAFTALPGDLSVLDDLLFVPVDAEASPRDIVLPRPWQRVATLREEITGRRIDRSEGGAFLQAAPGIYRMKE